MNRTARPDDLPPYSPPALTGSVVHLPNLFRAVWRARLWIFLTPFVIAAIAVVWTSLQEPEYVATASLLVEGEDGGEGMLAQRVAAFTGIGGGGGSLETDLQLLQSRRVGEAVVDSLALRVRMPEPQLPRSEIFTSVRAGRDGFVGRIFLSRVEDDRYTIELELPESAPVRDYPVPSSVSAGDSFEIGGVSLQLGTLAEGEAPDLIELHVVSFRAAVDGFLGQLEAGRVGGSNVVEVTVRHTDPVLAAGSSNAVVERFIEYRRQSSRSDARGAIDFLREQVAQYEAQLRGAENRLRSFREQEAVVSPDEAASQQAQRLGALDAQRAELIAERDVLAELVREVAATSGTETGTSAYRKLAAFPEFFRNPTVQNILSSLVQLENRRADLLVQRTTDSRDVRGISDRIQDLEEQLYGTATNYLASLDEQISAVNRTLERSAGQASRIPEVQTEFLRLSREVELLDEIYSLLQMRLKEQEVSEADLRSDIRPLDAALIPLTPVSPRPALALLLALVVGTMLGLAIALAKAVLDPAMYSKEVAVAAAGGLPVLTTIPQARRASARLLPMGRGSLRRTSRPQIGQSNGASGGPGESAAVEAYTDLRTRLAMFTDPPPRVVLVTSPRVGDGKSTVAANLAMAYARHGTRTLLLEGDLRRGGLVERLGLVSSENGFGKVLHGSTPAVEAIQEYVVGDWAMDVLPAGHTPRHPSELLDSPDLARLMSEFRDRYEMIVVDTPPLDSVADALLLARLADGAVLVTRAGATDRDALELAMAELSAVGTHVHGLVLNGFGNGSRTSYAYGA